MEPQVRRQVFPVIINAGHTCLRTHSTGWMYPLRKKAKKKTTPECLETLMQNRLEERFCPVVQEI